MSDKKNSVINEELVKALPQEGVHCFPASSKVINRNRIVSAIFAVLGIAGGIYFLLAEVKSIALAICCFVVTLISILVFAQSFLIAKYRVAVDYKNKNVVLRYRYSSIEIPFENFDARDGSPDRAEALVEGSILGGKDKVQYLILDDVLDDACYQTSSRDLASIEDFNTLKAEALKIAEAYCASELEGAIKIEEQDEERQNSEINDIVSSVMDEDTNKKADNE